MKPLAPGIGGNLGGPPGYTFSQARGINDAGQVVGYSGWDCASCMASTPTRR